MANSVLILGGGLTGLQAAVAVAAAGARAVVVENGPIVGGKRAAWLEGGDGVDGRLAKVGEDSSVELLTLAQLKSLAGEAGSFTATISQRPRFVTADCTRCNNCAPVCPQPVSNEYDAGLTFRKAIHSPYPRTIPDIFSIDIDSCLNSPPNYLPCQRCVEVCDDNAIHFDMPVEPPFLREVAAVVVATGFADNDDNERNSLAEFGYGEQVDVLSSVELQRMLEDPGPSGGFAIRPSDESYPDRIVLVMTRVSANAAWVMNNQLRRLVAQGVEQVSLLVLSSETGGEELRDLQATIAELDIPLLQGSWLGLDKNAEGELQVRYVELPAGRTGQLDCDLVVLSSEVHAQAAAAGLAETLALTVNGQGYLTPSRPGIYIAGGAIGTVGIEAGAEQALAVVESALAHLPNEVEEQAGNLPSWTGLPQDKQQEYLESLLHSLLQLGERSQP